ncbi:MAG: hypothetical protein JXX14_23750 [Deltaproteobacteria bacterium]|nr:hypothetical protein [Deltaproteobacteria bacterium]
MQRLKYFFCVLIFFTTPTTMIHADEPDAGELFNQGISLFENGSYDAAAKAFVAAHETKPTWKILFNIAQAYAAAKKYGLALDYFEKYLAQGGDDIPQDRMTEIIGEVDRLRKMVGVISVSAPEGTELLIDGESRGTVPLPGNTRVAMGEHTFVLTKDGEILASRRLVITGSMVTAISVDDESELDGADPAEPVVETDADAFGTGPSSEEPGLPPLRKRKLMFIGGIVSAALGAAGIGLGTAFLIKGGNDNDALKAAEAEYSASNYTSVAAYDKASAADEDLRLDRTMVIVGFATGTVFAASSVVLLLVSRKFKNEQRSLHPMPGGLSVTF